MVVTVDLVHSERLVSAHRAGLSAETVTLDWTAVLVTLSRVDFEVSFRSEIFSEGMSLL